MRTFVLRRGPLAPGLQQDIMEESGLIATEEAMFDALAVLMGNASKSRAPARDWVGAECVQAVGLAFTLALFCSLPRSAKYSCYK